MLELQHTSSKTSTQAAKDPDNQEANVVHPQSDGLHRRLSNRQIQLVAMGGSIGTGLFIAIGGALHKGGPASLLLAVGIQCIMVSMLNNCLAEMTTYMPVTGGFIALAGKWVDDAWGFLAGWNFFIFAALTIPFEISAVNVLLGFWRDDIPSWAVLINFFTVKAYGEAEFWLSGGKVILILMLFCFTFITMVGGNPKHDVYGFRHWNNPGPFAEFAPTSGTTGRFEGFLAPLWTAIFIVTGPEYISMVSPEAKHPRIYLKQAFKVLYVRCFAFYVGGAICVGVILAYNDPTLTAAQESGSSSAAASPYIIAMNNLAITGLPHITTALMLTSVLAAGNTYWYSAIRSLYGLAVGGRAPRIFLKTNSRGIPIYCFMVAAAFGCLSFMQVSGDSMTVLNWLISLTTANVLINYVVISVTYICFHRACQAQGFDRRKLPYYGRFQPYCGYIAAGWMLLMLLCFGYRSLRPFSVDDFFLTYTMVILAPIVFGFWKVFKKTRWLRPSEVDLHWQANIIALYEASETEQPFGFFRDVIRMFGVRKGGRGAQHIGTA
ncbi:amino acid permease/ SLC12A domain-containing protein [Aspergillus karnatakaensis]|uniref:amino acid permease/ SLC12A domain-containing protein n=1 Tax=Aspergillus karnatakaensis TaxID=1810916 RepID=UPI003CCCCB51